MREPKIVAATLRLELDAMAPADPEEYILFAARIMAPFHDMLRALGRGGVVLRVEIDEPDGPDAKLVLH